MFCGFLLKESEAKYSTSDIELLAVYLAIKQFCHFVEGCQFSITTDHKPQTFGLFTNSSKFIPHQIQHLDHIAQFTTDIIYTKGSNSPVANALPSTEANALHSNAFIDLQERAVAQETEPDLVKFQITMSSLKLKAISLPSSDTTILCETSTEVPRPYVPEQFHHKVFDYLHLFSHPSIRVTQHLVTAHFVWPG